MAVEIPNKSVTPVSIAPDTASEKIKDLQFRFRKLRFTVQWQLICLTRWLMPRILPFLGGSGFLLRTVSVDKDRSLASKFTLLYPAETIDFGNPAEDRFLSSCQTIQDGKLTRANIFVCELDSAFFFPESGLVLDKQKDAIIESVLNDERFQQAKKVFKPRKFEKRQGTYSSIQHLWIFNNWHWMVDCIPQVRSLEKIMEGKELTLLMPNFMNKLTRESLECVLPPNFKVELVDPNTWIQVDKFILPSYVSGRLNGYLPQEYYDFIRDSTRKALGVTKPANAAGRYYISRARAQHRRVENEEELVTLLSEFGFERILIEKYSYKEQVELFSGAEVILSPHGAALGGIMFGDNLKVCVLYPEARPGEYFYTLARGLGHQHFSWNTNLNEDDNFVVDIPELRRILVEEMKL